MPEWKNWHNTFRAPVNRILSPGSLDELQRMMESLNLQERRIHAQGSRWAFSAPAYCEDVVIDTARLRRFPQAVQRSLRSEFEPPDRLLVAAEAGMLIHDFYRAVAFDHDRNYSGPRPELSPTLTNGRIWTLPVLGGAGGQSLAGAISTGTHGGDVARPPLSDAVRAILLVVEGGRLLLLQRGEVLDPARLEAELGQSIEVNVEPTVFNAAVVDVGRFGIIWAYVLEVRDETSVAIVETRERTTWPAVRSEMLREVTDAQARDEYFGFVLNPYHRDFVHACFVTRHVRVAGNPTDPTADPRMPHVRAARSASGARWLFQFLGLVDPADFLTNLNTMLDAMLGPPHGPVVIAKLVECIGKLGNPRPNGEPYILGDLVAEILELLNTFGRPDVIETLNTMMLDVELRDVIAGPASGMWRVKGTRFEVADFYDYGETTYRGDSVEIFYPVDASLPDAIDDVLHVFDILRVESMQVGAYVAVRFMERTTATLGLARWSPTCSIEIAVIGGIRGNERALNLLKDSCVGRGGLLHWGQRSELSPVQVERAFGSALNDWRNALHAVHGSSRAFSSPFTRDRGLEWYEPADWSGWHDLGHVGTGAATLPAGFESGDFRVFARNVAGIVEYRLIRSDGMPVGPWRTVRPEPITGAITALSGWTGRLELFAIDDGFLRHTWEVAPGRSWSSWDTKGFPAPIRYDPHTEIAVAAHADGRLETFGRASDVDDRRLAHCWANARDGWGWSTVWHRGLRPIGSSPSAVNRRLSGGDDHLVVVATDPSGAVQWMQQDSTADTSGWTDWEAIFPLMHTNGRGGAVAVAPEGLPVHVFAVDRLGRIHYTTDASSTITPRWTAWTAIPSSFQTDGRPSVVSTRGRIWITARGISRDDVRCWEIAPGRPVVEHNLNGVGTLHVSGDAFPGEDALYVVARGRDGSLHGRRVEPSP